MLPTSVYFMLAVLPPNRVQKYSRTPRISRTLHPRKPSIAVQRGQLVGAPPHSVRRASATSLPFHCSFVLYASVHGAMRFPDWSVQLDHAQIFTLVNLTGRKSGRQHAQMQAVLCVNERFKVAHQDCFHVDFHILQKY